MSEEIGTEIDNMLKAFNEPIKQPEEEKEEVAEDKKPEEENSKGEEKKEEEEEVDETSEDKDKDESKDESTNEESSDEEIKPDEKDTLIAELKTRLETLENANKKEDPEEKDTTPKVHDFVGELDPYEVTNDKEGLNNLLNQVYSQGITDVRESLSDIVAEKVNLVLGVKEARDRFYEENVDLKPYNKVVATVFGEIAKENSNRSYNDILKDVAKEARKRLKLSDTKQKKSNESKPPRLPSKKAASGKPTEEKLKNPVQSELDEMNEALGR